MFYFLHRACDRKVLGRKHYTQISWKAKCRLYVPTCSSNVWRYKPTLNAPDNAACSCGLWRFHLTLCTPIARSILRLNCSLFYRQWTQRQHRTQPEGKPGSWKSVETPCRASYSTKPSKRLCCLILRASSFPSPEIDSDAPGVNASQRLLRGCYKHTLFLI